MEFSEYAALFFQTGNEIAYLADIDSHEIKFMTPGYRKLAGLSNKEDYEGKKCYEVLHGRTTPCPFCSVQQQKMLDNIPQTLEQYRPNLKKWLKLRTYWFAYKGARYRGEWLIDAVNERKELSDSSERLKFENTLLRCVQVLTDDTTNDQPIDLFLQQVGEYYEAARVYLFEFNFERGQFSNTFEWCAPGVPGKSETIQNVPVITIDDWIPRLERDETIVVQNPGDGLQTQLLVPVWKDGVLTGCLGLESVRNLGADDRLLRFVSGFITEEFRKRRLLHTIRQVQFIDRLTDLPNRKSYVQQLEAYTDHLPKSMGVFYLDLNGLRELNEQIGQNAGDGFLQSCAKILRDLQLNAFRAGGDEFIVLQENISKAEFGEVEQKLRTELKKLEPNTVALGTAWMQGRFDIFKLVQQADEIMHAEKQVYYRTVFRQNPIRQSGGVAADLLQEIQDGRFDVYYQPQINLQDGSIYGAEALVRKFSPDGKMIPPDNFVPQYENEGIISHMDLHVLEKVCKKMVEWRDELGHLPHISVNFSRVTLMEPGIVERIQSICDEYEIPVSSIMIEVTESIGKLSHEQLYALVQNFQERGFSVSLDDFGSRYSNLSVLTYIEFELIKLDKSLIDRVETDQKSTGIIEHLIYLCRNVIGTPALAEGVETADQLAVLRDFSCDCAQGYYFSKPVPAEVFTQMLRENRVYSFAVPRLS